MGNRNNALCRLLYKLCMDKGICSPLTGPVKTLKFHPTDFKAHIAQKPIFHVKFRQNPRKFLRITHFPLSSEPEKPAFHGMI